MAKKLSIALAGNPNSGKTTVFNALTGARQHVANYPGVTVEKKRVCVDTKTTTSASSTCPGLTASPPGPSRNWSHETS